MIYDIIQELETFKDVNHSISFSIKDQSNRKLKGPFTYWVISG